MVACDVYRPAAIDQLKQLGKQLNIEVYEEGKKDPVEIAKNAIKYAKDNKYDYVLIDTAGRLHIDEELMDELEKHPEGFVNLSSHVGNYEIAGYSLKPKAKRFNALVFAGETDTVMENRQRLLSQNNMRLILVKEDLSHLFELNAAIDNGEIVSMPADRIFGSQKAVECQYFGEKARFPLGAFALAAQKNVSVLTVFVMKDGYKNYHAYVREIQCDREASIRTQMSQLAQSFASNLEEIVRKYPTQWFNYFDFWKQ